MYNVRTYKYIHIKKPIKYSHSVVDISNICSFSQKKKEDFVELFSSNIHNIIVVIHIQ